ncbi:MAG TPA: ATP-binding protein [Lachnospiraceae bacterium]|nr:ATP-binding protein [Lachnospiraceae bacterium]
MLFGRSNELNQLNHYYDREGSQIVVVYGQKNIGKTALIKEFSQDKSVSFYAARSCSEREQQFQWGSELSEEGIKALKYPSYEDIFMAITREKSEKKIIVVDEFQNMIKADSTFMKELISFMHRQWNKQQLLFILCSSSVGWVENSMIHKIGDAAYELSGLLKIKELKYKDCMDFFPGFSKQQCMETYAILGGLPGLWVHLNDKLSVKENIIRYVLTPSSSLYGEAERYVSEELRETGVYNTILASIAGGKHKLNDLYLHTGFSRAKISVYLKNLMELEIVEKVFSYDTEGHANVQKGIYRICNRFVHFYYKLIYPHLSRLQIEAPNAFYLSCISLELKSYVAEYFKDVCMEYLDDRNEGNILPFIYDRSGEWVGKDGNIDIIVQDEDANTMLAQCNYDKPMMTYEDYGKLLHCADKARLDVDFVMLFSVDRFDEKLELEAKVKKNLTLVSMKNM